MATLTNLAKNSTTLANIMQNGKGYLLNQLIMTLQEMIIKLQGFDNNSFTNLAKNSTSLTNLTKN